MDDDLCARSLTGPRARRRAETLANETRDVWVTYNGEIYNHLALRRELEHLGHTFRTRTDTEVLVHGWEAWGTRLVDRLAGRLTLPDEFVINTNRDPGSGGDYAVPNFDNSPFNRPVGAVRPATARVDLPMIGAGAMSDER